jgi:predicted membrane channel-forming protein YqfA (hemolysin III family)
MDIEKGNRKKLKISKLSITSAVLLVVSQITVVFQNMPNTLQPLIMNLRFLLLLASLILAIIDINKKNRMKTLSIVMAIFSSIPIITSLLFYVTTLIYGP